MVVAVVLMMAVVGGSGWRWVLSGGWCKIWGGMQWAGCVGKGGGGEVVVANRFFYESQVSIHYA